MRNVFLSAATILLTIPPTPGTALELHRGIGIHEWLNWAPVEVDGTYRQPPYQTTTEWRTRYRDLEDWPPGDEFLRIKAMGFDFVRVTVDPGPLLEDGGSRREEGLRVLREAVATVVAADLNVVFDFHLVPQVERFGQDAMEGPVDAPQLTEYRYLLRDTAEMLADIGVDHVAFEPMNEPQYYPCDGKGGEDWNRVMASFVAAIRDASADLTIIATGACGGGPFGLLNLDPAPFLDDPAILYSFHMYEPHEFTHQGVGDKEQLAGLPWPAAARTRIAVEQIALEATETSGAALSDGAQALLAAYYADDWGVRQMADVFADVRDWAAIRGIAPERIFVGEFGVVAQAPGRGGALPRDRARYLAAVRSFAESYGMAWSMWEYSNPHGMSLITPSGAALPDPLILEALGLRPD